MTPDIAIIIPCFNDGAYIVDTLRSIDTEFEVEVVVVDDGSNDPATLDVLGDIELSGTAQVLHVPNGGPGSARMAGLATTTAPLVLPLDADDQLVAGGLEALHAALSANPNAAFAFGDYVAFGGSAGRWTTPPWDPWALLYANWWPVTSLFRRDRLVAAGGWQLHGYEDWDLWLSLAEHGDAGVHCGAVVYARRLHGERVNTAARLRHAERYRLLRSRHPALFARRRELLGASRPSFARRALYPVMLGDRRFFPIIVENAVIAARLRRGARRSVS